jgi:hypothetical protein
VSWNEAMAARFSASMFVLAPAGTRIVGVFRTEEEAREHARTYGLEGLEVQRWIVGEPKAGPVVLHG